MRHSVDCLHIHNYDYTNDFVPVMSINGETVLSSELIPPVQRSALDYTYKLCNAKANAKVSANESMSE